MRAIIYTLMRAPSFKNQAALLHKTAIKQGFESELRDLSQPANLKKDKWDRAIFLAPLWPRYGFDAVRLSAPWLSRHFTFYGPVDGPLTLNIAFFNVLKQIELVTTSRWCQLQIQRSGVHCKGYVHHAIDPDDFKFKKDQVNARRERLERKDPGAFIFYSNCNPLARKGFNELAQALEMLRKDRPEGWIFVLHTGKAAALKFAPKLQKIPNLIIEDQYNALSFRQIALKYKAADCFVWPSLLEGFGLPLVEAMAAGLATICVNAGPMNEIATDETSFFVPVDHVNEVKWKHPGCMAVLHHYKPRDLCRAMIQALDSPKDVEKKAKAGLRRSRAFNYKKVYSAFVRGRVR
jgi:glycosyltransferase involved in cell wall biosynthesis